MGTRLNFTTSPFVTNNGSSPKLIKRFGGLIVGFNFINPTANNCFIAIFSGLPNDPTAPLAATECLDVIQVKANDQSVLLVLDGINEAEDSIYVYAYSGNSPTNGGTPESTVQMQLKYV